MPKGTTPDQHRPGPQFRAYMLSRTGLKTMLATACRRISGETQRSDAAGTAWPYQGHAPRTSATKQAANASGVRPMHPRRQSRKKEGHQRPCIKRKQRPLHGSWQSRCGQAKQRQTGTVQRPSVMKVPFENAMGLQNCSDPAKQRGGAPTIVAATRI